MIVDVHACAQHGGPAVLCRYVWSRPLVSEAKKHVRKATNRFPGSYAYGGWHFCWNWRRPWG